MNATWIVTVFEVTDTTMETLDHHSHVLTKVPDSEVLTVAVVAANYFQNHHECALAIAGVFGFGTGGVAHADDDEHSRPSCVGVYARLYARYEPGWQAFSRQEIKELSEETGLPPGFFTEGFAKLHCTP